MKIRKREKNVPFSRFLCSGMLNRFGDSIDVISMSWLIYLLSGSASLSALAVGVNYLPTIFIQPLAGAYVERVSKKRILVIMDLGRVLLVASLIFLYGNGLLRPEMLLATTFLISVLEAFRNPASSGILPRILKEEEYHAGISTYQTVNRIVELCGTGAAGILIAHAGIAGALLVDTSCFLFSALLVLKVEIKEEKKARKAREPYGKMLKEGFRYMKASRIILLLTLLCALLNGVLTPYQSLQSALVKEVYRKGSETLSFMNGGLSLGLLLGSFLYRYLAERIAIDKALMGCGILNGSFYLILTGLGRMTGQTFVFYFLMGSACLLFGMSIGYLNTALPVLMMKRIPVEYMSRESALINGICTAAIPVTSFGISAVAVSLDIRFILTAFGLLSIALMAFLKLSKRLYFGEDIDGDKSKKEVQPD